MQYVDYAFYKGNYNGDMPSTVFTRLSIEASAYIKRHTCNRIDINNVPEEVEYCTCSIIDKMLKIEKREGKKSESVGTWSVNYVEKSEDKKDLYDTLVTYLSDLVDANSIPLLYRGC